MSSYDFLAGCYDALTYDVDYSAWADYIEKHFRKNPLPGNTVLDLACGTGSLTRELALRGYELIGVDQSPADKNRGGSPVEPIFLCQSMENLDLYGTVDACVCCLDSVNYVTDPKKLRRAFQRVRLFLTPGGLFLFDINSSAKLEGLDGQVFLDETEDVFCVWRDIFRLDESTGQWGRGEELHRERAYTVPELTVLLEEAGFTDIRTFGDLKMRAPKPNEPRIFFTARKEI